MQLYVAALLVGLTGGWVLGAVVLGRRRVYVLCVWLVLPLIIYSAFFGLGFIEGGRQNLPETIVWWMLGLIGWLGLPMLAFAISSVFGFLIASVPAAKRS